MDTSKIEGYADMTAEQKLAALEGYEPEAPDLSGYVKKELLDKASSEAAGFKKQLRERMSAEEQAEVDRQQKQQEMETRYQELEERFNALQKQTTVSQYVTQLTSMGYDDKLAKDTAEAMAAGDAQKVLQNQAKFLEAREKQMKADALKRMSAPKGGGEETPPESDAVQIARQLGKAKADAGKSVGDVLSKYTLR